LSELAVLDACMLVAIVIKFSCTSFNGQSFFKFIGREANILKRRRKKKFNNQGKKVTKGPFLYIFLITKKKKY
jgi:hypothetical protein